MTELERLYEEICKDGDPVKGIVWGLAISLLAFFIMGCLYVIITYGNYWP